MSTAIHIDAVSKSFGSGPPAVDRISLRIEPGELFFLLGPSGCGKTTLLRMIAGFIEPTGGRILFSSPTAAAPPNASDAPAKPVVQAQGTQDRHESRAQADALPSADEAGLQWRDVTNLPPNRRETGMVFQSYALWPHMTVEANVAFGLTTRRVAAAERKRRVMEALEAVHMAEYAARRPNQLSGGQQQRVALARALVVRPQVLLLDEPLSNLDTRLRIELRSEIRRICKASGITTVYVTHDQKEALSMADRIAIVSKGRIAQIGTPRELYTRPTTRFVAEFLGEANIISGTVIGPSTHVSIVRTSIGDVPCYVPVGVEIERGGTWNILVRPEQLVLHGAGPTNAVVSCVTYLGETIEFELLAAELRLKATVAITDDRSGTSNLRVRDGVVVAAVGGTILQD
ncbi:MAG: ABC transporter ATP-binding protein [Phycisphaerales bacterium]